MQRAVPPCVTTINVEISSWSARLIAFTARSAIALLRSPVWPAGSSVPSSQLTNRS